MRLVDAGAVTFKQFGFNGGQGDDSVHYSTVAGTALSATIGGGGGNDTVNAVIKVATASTVAGGGGDDTVTITLSAAQASFIGGDNGDMSLNSYDGDDLITGVMVNGSGNTVFAGGGNDTLNLQLSGMDNDRIALNLGDDSLALTGQLKGLTIEAGAGNDSVTIALTGISGSYTLGGGDDSITFSQGMSGAMVSASSYGGAGADVLAATEGNSAAAYGLTFGFNAYTDSTAAGFDSIQVGDGSGDTYTALFVGGGITRAANFTDATNFTGVDGVVTFWLVLTRI